MMRQRNKLFRFIALAVIALVAAVVLFVYDPASSHLFPPCPFHRFTGLYCPGCGSLRALHQLFGGHVYAAFELNPLMVLFLPFVLYGLLAQVLRDFLNKKIPAVSLSSFWIWLIFGVIVAYGVLRNIPVAPFTYLAP